MSHGEYVVRIEEFLKEARNSSATDFVDRYPSPVLVAIGGDFDTAAEFHTQVVDPTPNRESSKTSTSFPPKARVFKVEKRQGANPYSQMVILGRAPNSDIVLNSSETSKMHAYFHWEGLEEEAICKIVDGNSRNGTWVNAHRLLPHKPCNLNSADVIRLGSTIALQFFYAKDFFKSLAKRSMTADFS